MKPRAFRLFIGLALLPPSALAVAAENPLSTYTRALTDLLSVFGKLNTAVADQMKENERYLLAKWMLNLSNGFYGLMNAKADLTKEMEQSSGPGASINYSTYVPAVQRLQKEVECVSAQLKDKGAGIGALSGIDGIAVEHALRAGLEEKVSDLKKVVEDMGMEPSGPGGLALKATIEADGEKARQTAERLYKMTAEFARVLDPTVIPEHPGPCVDWLSYRNRHSLLASSSSARSTLQEAIGPLTRQRDPEDERQMRVRLTLQGRTAGTCGGRSATRSELHSWYNSNGPPLIPAIGHRNLTREG